MLKDIDETLNWDAVVGLAWKNYQKKNILTYPSKIRDLYSINSTVIKQYWF